MARIAALPLPEPTKGRLRAAILAAVTRYREADGYAADGLWILDAVPVDVVLDFVEGRRARFPLPRPPAVEMIEERFVVEVKGRTVALPPVELPSFSFDREGQLELGAWFAPPDVQLLHVVRLDHVLGNIEMTMSYPDESYYHWHNMSDHVALRTGAVKATTHLIEYRARCPEPFGLAELNEAVNSLPGTPEDALLRWAAGHGGCFTGSDYRALVEGWAPEAIHPAFMERPQALKAVLDHLATVGVQITAAEWAQGLCRTLALLPELPGAIDGPVWRIARGEHLGVMTRDVQRALADKPGTFPRVVAMLGERRTAVRAAAAGWLGDLGRADAVSALCNALALERTESVRTALVRAIAALDEAALAGVPGADAVLAERGDRSVTALWARIERWLEEHGPQILASFAPPASADALADLERTIGAPLPADLRELLELHDGQDLSRPFIGLYRLLPASEIAERWRLMQQVNAAESFGDGFWRAAIVPFLADEGNLFCLDRDLADASGIAPVVEKENIGEITAPVASSLCHLLGAIADRLEAGQLEPSSHPFLGLEPLSILEILRT